MVLIPYQLVKLFKGTLLFNLFFYVVVVFFTLEPGSLLSEESWHPVRKAMQCHFHAGLRPKCTWSSPLPGVSSLKLEDPHLSVEVVECFLLLLDLLLNWERSWNLHVFLHWIIVMPSSHTPVHILQRTSAGQIIKAATVKIVMALPW